MRTTLSLRSVCAIALCSLLAALVAPPALPLSAQEGIGGHISGDRQRPTADVDITLADALQSGLAGPLNQPLQVLIVLEGQPSAQAYADALQAPGNSVANATAAAQSQLAANEAAQQQLLPQLAALGVSVIYRVQRVDNGIAVAVSPDQVAALRKLPGVADLRILVPKTLNNAYSVPLIAAPEFWEGIGIGQNITGDGLSIGVIDTGVDYIHTNFGGSGDEADYAANNTEVITDNVGFPSAKVVGGYDFAGPDYDAFPSSPYYNPIPAPDPDPFDCDGHGSHVAGSATGLGVEADGDTYQGAYDTSINFADLRIGPGVAPEADLYALKVFGCPDGSNAGSTLVSDLALEWAVDPNGDGNFADRLDVVNMSLGAPYGDNRDASAVAANNAALAGVIVVTSAGNEGDTFYVTGSPGTADRVISVAASVDSTDTLDGFEVTNSITMPNGVYPAYRAVLYDWLTDTLPISGTLVYPPSQRGGCQPFTAENAAIINGNVVLLDWTHLPDGVTNECGSLTRTNNAEAAGAIGVVFAFNLPYLDAGINGNANIPAVMTTKEVGDMLKASLPGVVIVFSNDYVGTEVVTYPGLVDTLAGFSSRGPRDDALAKPDIAAPGVSIYSTGAGTGDQGAPNQGTSMAAPHVAGAMVLLRQLHPDWSVEELKALVMNTALHDLRFSNVNTTTVPITATILPPSRVGAGRIDLNNAGASDVVAYNWQKNGIVSLSAGALEVVTGTSQTVNRTVELANQGGSAMQYYVEYQSIIDAVGVTVTPGASTVTVAADSTATFQVTTAISGSQLLHEVDPTLTPFDGLRNWLNEEQGYVMMVPVGARFAAALTGDNEVPPVATSMTGQTAFVYNAATNVLSYTLDVTTTSALTITAAHIHYGLEGVNGGIAQGLFTGPTSVNGSQQLSAGAVTLTAEQERLLLGDALYVDVHTSANPGGAIRGQIESVGAPALRLPYYASARPASNMAAQPSVEFEGTGDEAVIALTGQGIEQEDNPFETVSLVSAFELVEQSGSLGRDPEGDLQYLGISTDFPAYDSLDSDAAVFFAVATHGKYASPSAVETDVYIDANQDGSDDYWLVNWNLGSALGGDPNDVFITVLFDLNNGGGLIEDLLNYWPASLYDMAPYNTNTMVLPVYLADLAEFQGASPAFNYYVVTQNRYGPVDISEVHTYDPTRPGLDFTGDAPGLTTWLDVPGAGIPVIYDQFSYEAYEHEGILLFHHHNVFGQRAQVVQVRDASDPTLAFRIWLPVIGR